MNRATYGDLVEKLDRNLLSLKEAKSYAAKLGCKTNARTKRQLISELSKMVYVK